MKITKQCQQVTSHCIMKSIVARTRNLIEKQGENSSEAKAAAV